MGVKKDGDSSADISEIKELVRNQYKSLNWTREKDGNWGGFTDTFLSSAALFPAARPVKSQTADQFVERMKRLRAEGKLATFAETPLGCEVRVFGNVAVALAGCEMLENGSDVTRDVSCFLVVKDNGVWRVAAQAWDVETESRKIPADLAARETE